MIKFVPATESDKEYLLALRKRTMNQHLARAGQFLAEKEHEERVNYKFDGSRLVYRGSQLIGAVKCNTSAKEFELIQMQIDLDYQGLGYGSEIIRELLASETGKMIKLNVLKENPALKFYKRQGFEVIGEDEYEFHMCKKH